MKQRLGILLIGAVVSSLAYAAPKSGHYAAIDGKQGKELFDAIHTTAKQGYRSLSYKGIWTSIATTDRREDGTIWDMYSNCSFTYSTDQDKGGGGKAECDYYNREHGIPKDWFGGTTANNTPGTDIFHVVPTDKFVNNQRSAMPYGEVGKATTTFNNGSKIGNSNFGGYSGRVFEPIDEYKGDFARAYFGTLLRWANGDYQAFTTGSGSVVFNGTYTSTGNFGLTTYGVTLLIKWHRQDPVSEKELNRNDGIEKTQGNRNPFIDYPELAEYLWGNKKGETVKLSALKSSYDSDATGMEMMQEEKYTLSIQQQMLQIEAATPVQVLVYDYMGHLCLLTEGTNITAELPRGIYIVCIGGQTEKIIIQQ